VRALEIVLLFAAAALGQPPVAVLMGTAAGIAGDQLIVQTGPGTTTLVYADASSQIWRGKMTDNLAALQPGDDVILRYRRDAAGRLIIIDLHANIDHITGRITRVGHGEFDVDQNYDADPHSAYRRQNRVIVFDADTSFQESLPEDLKVGRDVDIIGLKTGGAHVQATRITIYEGRAPVRMPPGTKIIAPDGTVRTRP